MNSLPRPNAVPDADLVRIAIAIADRYHSEALWNEMNAHNSGDVIAAALWSTREASLAVRLARWRDGRQLHDAVQFAKTNRNEVTNDDAGANTPRADG